MVIGIDLGQSVYDLAETSRHKEYSDKAADMNIQYTQGLYEDNNRYWDRYIKKHHLEGREIMFPYRTGYQFNQAPIYSNQATKVQNEKALGDAMFKVANKLVKFLFDF